MFRRRGKSLSNLWKKLGRKRNLVLSASLSFLSVMTSNSFFVCIFGASSFFCFACRNKWDRSLQHICFFFTLVSFRFHRDFFMVATLFEWKFPNTSSNGKCNSEMDRVATERHFNYPDFLSCGLDRNMLSGLIIKLDGNPEVLQMGRCMRDCSLAHLRSIWRSFVLNSTG